MRICGLQWQIAVVVLSGTCLLIACQPADVKRETQTDALTDSALPAGDALTGWEMSSRPEYYVPENLWDYINGQAEFYLNYGFVRVDTAEYRSESGSPSVIVEIYQMSSAEEAFGIYAAERSPGDRELDIGSGSYLGSNVLNFWQANTYIKLTSFDTGATNDEALIALAREIEQRIPPGSGVPETLSYFPEEGRIEGSERFIPRSFLGQSYLKRAYRVDYSSSSGGSYQLFLARLGAADEARAALARYCDFVRSQGQKVELIDEDSATLVSESGAATVIFLHGEYFGGSLDATSVEDGRIAAGKLSERLAEMK
jgi:hypothetical protein